MPTNKQRRDAARRHLERQLERRQERDVRRRKMNLILSIVLTLVLIAVAVVVIAWSQSDDKKNLASSGGTSSTSQPAPSTSAAPLPQPTTACTKTSGPTVNFDGVTIKNATNLSIAPVVTSKVTAGPPALVCADLVVGKGALATPTSTVSVQYVGALLSNGTVFDASWKNGGKPVSFPLTGVVPGFTQGIGGAGKAAPMRVGGRRIMILPAVLAYGASPPSGSGIPVNAPLVFIVDLKSITPPASSSAAG